MFFLFFQSSSRCCFFLPPPPPPPDSEEELERESTETLLEANVGPDSGVATMAASEASDGGGSIGCGGGGGTREAAAAFFQEEGVSEGEEEDEEEEVEEVELDFAALARLRDDADGDASSETKGWRPRCRAFKTSPRSIGEIRACLALLLKAGSRRINSIESADFSTKRWRVPKADVKSEVRARSDDERRRQRIHFFPRDPMALRTCLFAASRSLPRASARPAATTPIVRAMSSAVAQKDVPPPANTPSKVSGIERKDGFLSPRLDLDDTSHFPLFLLSPSSKKKQSQIKIALCQTASSEDKAANIAAATAAIKVRG